MSADPGAIDSHPLLTAADLDPAALDRAERSANIGVWRWDAARRETVWSANFYRLLGLTPGEPASPDAFLAVIHPEDREQMRGAVENVLSGREHGPQEYRVVHADGRVRHLVSATALAREGSHRGPVVVGLVSDVTGRRESQRVAELNGAVAGALAAWNGFRPGAERLLGGFARALDARAAALWVPQDGTLTVRAVWSADESTRGTLERRLREIRPRRGGCVAGRAWSELAPVVDSSSQATTERLGLPGSIVPVLAFPAVGEDQAIAVIVLYSAGPMDEGPALTGALVDLGRQLGSFLARRAAALRRPLSARETEVLTLAAQGLPGPAIAERLSLSSATVKTHLANAYAKLGASNRVAAVAYALREGLIE